MEIEEFGYIFSFGGDEIDIMYSKIKDEMEMKKLTRNLLNLNIINNNLDNEKINITWQLVGEYNMIIVDNLFDREDIDFIFSKYGEFSIDYCDSLYKLSITFSNIIDYNKVINNLHIIDNELRYSLK